jgi:dolichol-phosphate mannosyltransferase
MGVIGEYLGRVVEEVKRRPLFVIGTLHRHGKDYLIPSDFYRMELSDQRGFCCGEFAATRP